MQTHKKGFGRNKSNFIKKTKLANQAELNDKIQIQEQKHSTITTTKLLEM